ncbi:HupE/UreJ family protein [Curvibacter sp. APW13]|uniref:HupE/UreJ family protein n=1 Tax=Curvibacter sp. APW13 TaxID=3077236 RepID=UPI0028DDC8F8|nr:HupE/UreJ family protein [Curvibacter sp. APW13]MDT8991497.1 HupE/UreJ family protein [Curvibacter sp. APW13]
MTRALHWLGCVLLWFGLAHGVAAHEALPASMILREQAPGLWNLAWRVPEVQGAPLEVRPLLPASCIRTGATTQYQAPGARLWKWTVRCGDSFPYAEPLAFDGLELAGIDVLVRAQWVSGHSETRIARAKAPGVSFAETEHPALATSAYFGLGVEHILSGTDHLLFVLCLMLLVPGYWPLLKTITAFTLAHSLTLALAALQWIHVPQPPIEALIALSILFLAREIAQRHRHAGPSAPGEATRYWLVAFAFGLLHGFGFAGALSEVGLPQEAIAPALLLFNLGVEAGQVLFILLCWPLLRLASRLGQVHRRAATILPVYAVGSIAGFWFLQRLVPVLGLGS